MAAEIIELDRGLEPQSKPFRAERRYKQRRDLYVLRIGRSRDRRDKFNHALDLFRAMAKDPSVDHAAADNALAALTQTLVEASDALAKTLRRHR